MSDQIERKKPIELPENVPTDYEFERMLKTFLKDVQKSGVIEEVKRRRYFIKPNEKRRLRNKGKRSY